METMTKLVASLLLLVLSFECSSAYKCYICSSTINENNEELDNNGNNGTYSCAKALELKSDDNPNNYSCHTQYKMNGASTDITRDVEYTTISNYCTNSGDRTDCYCNTTDNCNSEKIAVPTSYECYECESSTYFDNGCGSTLDPDSIYVRQVKGCSACFKTFVTHEDHSLIYRRGCGRSIDIQEGCVYADVGQIGQSCACKGPLCNSAETVALKSVTVFTAVVLSAAFKLIC